MSTIRRPPCCLLARCAVPLKIPLFPAGGYFDFTPILQSFVAIRYYVFVFLSAPVQTHRSVWEALSLLSFFFRILFSFFFFIIIALPGYGSRFLFSVICFLPLFALRVTCLSAGGGPVFYTLINPHLFSLSIRTPGFRLSGLLLLKGRLRQICFHGLDMSNPTERPWSEEEKV